MPTATAIVVIVGRAMASGRSAISQTSRTCTPSALLDPLVHPLVVLPLILILLLLLAPPPPTTAPTERTGGFERTLMRRRSVRSFPPTARREFGGLSAAAATGRRRRQFFTTHRPSNHLHLRLLQNSSGVGIEMCLPKRRTLFYLAAALLLLLHPLPPRATPSRRCGPARSQRESFTASCSVSSLTCWTLFCTKFIPSRTSSPSLSQL